MFKIITITSCYTCQYEKSSYDKNKSLIIYKCTKMTTNGRIIKDIFDIPEWCSLFSFEDVFMSYLIMEKKLSKEEATALMVSINL
jgi:hypothetical protein